MPAILKQDAAYRTREGGFLKQTESRELKAKAEGTLAEHKRARGRPPGAKNKPKSLIPPDLAKQFLESMKTILPEARYNEFASSLRTGKPISTVTEAKVVLNLMTPSLMKRLIEEYNPDAGLDAEIVAEIGGRSTEFKKDTNERLGVWMKLLEIVHKMETREEDANSTKADKKPVFEFVARRGIDTRRLGILIDLESGPVGGSADGTRRPTITIGAIPDSVPQRQEHLPDSEQMPPVRNVTGT